jgi:hypothetical protein
MVTFAIGAALLGCRFVWQKFTVAPLNAEGSREKYGFFKTGASIVLLVGLTWLFSYHKAASPIPPTPAPAPAPRAPEGGRVPTDKKPNAPPDVPKEAPPKEAKRTPPKKKSAAPVETANVPDKPESPPVGGFGNAATGTINAQPCSVVQVGGIGNQATGGNCGPPEPNLTWSIEPREKTPDIKPNETRIILSVDRSLDIPAFWALCEGPCRSLSNRVVIEGLFGNVTTITSSVETRFVGLTFTVPNPLGAGTKVYWLIESLDNTPVKIAQVHIMTPEDKLRLLRR